VSHIRGEIHFRVFKLLLIYRDSRHLVLRFSALASTHVIARHGCRLTSPWDAHVVGATINLRTAAPCCASNRGASESVGPYVENASLYQTDNRSKEIQREAEHVLQICTKLAVNPTNPLENAFLRPLSPRSPLVFACDS
jgi:hypothetical protein